MKSQIANRKSQIGRRKINSVSASALARRRASRSRMKSLRAATTHPSASAMFAARAIDAAHGHLFHTTSAAEFQFLKRELDQRHSSAACRPKRLSPELAAWAIAYFRKIGAPPGQPAAGVSALPQTESGCAQRSRRKASNRKGVAAQSGALARDTSLRGVSGSCLQANGSPAKDKRGAA